MAGDYPVAYQKDNASLSGVNTLKFINIDHFQPLSTPSRLEVTFNHVYPSYHLDSRTLQYGLMNDLLSV